MPWKKNKAILQLKDDSTYLFEAEEEYTPAPKLRERCQMRRSKKYSFQVHETYAPPGFARLVLNDVFNIEQRGQVVSVQSLVFPGAPRVHFRFVPWYRKTSLPTAFLLKI